jgi:hypothetical protein
VVIVFHTMMLVATAYGTPVSLEQAQVDLYHRCGVAVAIDVHSTTGTVDSAVFTAAAGACTPQALVAALHPSCEWFVEQSAGHVTLRAGALDGGRCIARPSSLDLPSDGRDVLVQLKEREVELPSTFGPPSLALPPGTPLRSATMVAREHELVRHGWGVLPDGEPYDVLQVIPTGAVRTDVWTIQQEVQYFRCFDNAVEHGLRGDECPGVMRAWSDAVNAERLSVGLPAAPRSRPQPAAKARLSTTVEQRERIRAVGENLEDMTSEEITSEIEDILESP